MPHSQSLQPTYSPSASIPSLALGTVKLSRYVLVVLLTLLPPAAIACTVPPALLSLPTDRLVQGTEHIALAQVVNLEGFGNDRGKFSFETVSVLKGEPPESFTLEGYIAESVRGAPADFNRHIDPGFWAYGSGNTIQPADCVAHGIFQVGETYLVFLRTKSHYRAFENIRASDDLWLNLVKTLIQHEKDIGT